MYIYIYIYTHSQESSLLLLFHIRLGHGPEAARDPAHINIRHTNIRLGHQESQEHHTNIRLGHGPEDHTSISHIIKSHTNIRLGRDPYNNKKKYLYNL